MVRVRTVSVGTPVPVEWAGIGRTSIEKHAVAGEVAAHRLGLAGDQVADTRHHGGPDQAVYAYAREDLDWWAAELGAEIRDGQFGENLTTEGIDVNEAEIGERWEIGSAVLEVATVRIPCQDFRNWQRLNGYDDRRWVRRFTEAGRPGPYLRVVGEGALRAGDEIRVAHRPGHGVTVRLAFRALTTEPTLLPRLLEADALTEKDRAKAAAYVARDSPVSG